MRAKLRRALPSDFCTSSVALDHLMEFLILTNERTFVRGYEIRFLVHWPLFTDGLLKS